MRIYAKPEAFARARIIQGLSQRELARKTGFSHAYISLIERALKSVGPAAAKRLCSTLDKELEELFVIQPGAQPPPSPGRNT